MRKSNIKIFKKNNYCLTIATKRDAKHKVKSLKKKGFIAYIQKYKIILNKKMYSIYLPNTYVNIKDDNLIVYQKTVSNNCSMDLSDLLFKV